MNEYKILTDSTSDLPLEILKKFDIEAIPFTYQFGDGEVFVDKIDEEREKRMRTFYTRLKNGEMPTTSQINPGEFRDFFEPILAKNKDILFISFSSGLSSSYNSAQMAAKQLMEEYPDRKINVIDSLCASLGEGLLVYEAALLKEKWMNIDSLTNWIKENRLKVQHPNIIGSLKHLKRGGRISSTQAFFGSLLNVMPMSNINSEGKLELLGKKRGMKNAIDFILQKMKNDDAGQRIFISYSDCKSKALEVAEIIKKEFDAEILVNEIGTTVGAHIGPNTIGVFYMKQ